MFVGSVASGGSGGGGGMTGIVGTGDSSQQTLNSDAKRRKINLMLDQCESIRFPFKKKLSLSHMSLTANDIPLADLCGTSLGNSLWKLSLAGNRLGTVPAQLVVSLPSLRNLDLSQCELHQLPANWNLPKLTKINLSHNRLTDFPEEVSTQFSTLLSLAVARPISHGYFLLAGYLGRATRITGVEYVWKQGS